MNEISAAFFFLELQVSFLTEQGLASLIFIYLQPQKRMSR
jgi:hypothetical protein